nr:MAG: E5_EPSILON [Pan troglodytes papillomavirus 1]
MLLIVFAILFLSGLALCLLLPPFLSICIYAWLLVLVFLFWIQIAASSLKVFMLYFCAVWCPLWCLHRHATHVATGQL